MNSNLQRDVAYKTGIPPSWDEIFHMELQGIIYEEFLTLQISR